MLHPYQFCPKCQKVRGMSISLSLTHTQLATGEADALMINLHCERCQTFVGQIPYPTQNTHEQFEYVELLPSRPQM